MPLELTPKTPPYYEIVDGPAPAGTKYYTALISQTGTNAPTVTILENTIGNIIWTRTNVGRYKGTLAAAFPVAKTTCMITPTTTFSAVKAVNNEANEPSDEITVFSWSGATDTFGDDLLYLNTLKIEVYP